MTDFFQEWASARNFLVGLPLYTNHRVTIPRYLGRSPLGEKDLLVEVNAHPPTSVLLALPLAGMSYSKALLVWNLLSLAMFFLSLVIVGRGLRIPLSGWSLIPAATLIFLCFPLLMNIHFGQLSLLILLILTGVWAADRADRRILAGVLLALAATIKLFPGAMLLYFAARRRWDTILASVISVAVITLLTGILFGFEVYSYYASHVIPRVSNFRGVWFNISLPGYWTKLFDPPVDHTVIQPLLRSPLLAWSAAVLTCTLLLTVDYRTVRLARTRDELDLSFGLTVTCMLLISPVTWDHYLVLLLIPLATVWIQLHPSPAPRGLFLAIVIALWSWQYLVFELTIPGGLARGIARPSHTLTIGSYQLYALIALLVLEVATMRRLRTAGSAGSSLAE